MRVLVISTPATCSSYTLHIVSRVLNIQNYNELYNPSIMKMEDIANTVETKLYNTDDYVVKFMTNYFRFNLLNFENIRWEIFDYIIFTERDNVTNQICSFYLMQESKQELLNKLKDNQKILTEIDNNSDIITFAKDTIEYYRVYKNKILDKYSDKCITFKYEMFQKNKEDYINELNKLTDFNFKIEHLLNKQYNISYKEIFSNYDEFQKEIHLWEKSI